MVKMVSLRRTAADRAESSDALGIPGNVDGPDSFDVHMDHNHLKKLGLDMPLPHGHEITLHAKGELVSSHMHDVDGEPRHSATFRFSHAGVEHEAPSGDGHSDIREDLGNSYERSENRRKK